jgi:hypothetical protein
MNKFLTCGLVVILMFVFYDRGASRTEAKKERFSILFLGDILLVNEAERYFLAKGKEYPFRKIKNDLLKYDFIFANLEAPVTERGLPFSNKAYSFRMRPDIALCIKDLKIDAVSISNNHLMDYDLEGMEDSLSYLDKLNIRHSGGGKNISLARKPAILKHGGMNIYILSYCDRPPVEYYASATRHGIAPLDLDMIREDIATYKTKDAIVFVSLHWGIEQTHRPQAGQKKTAHEIIDAGADAIIGHHPHWPQGIEVYKTKPIIYSLGNLINGYYNIIERDNIGVAMYFYRNNLEKIKILPIAGQNKKIQFQPFLLTGKSAESSLELIQKLSRELGTDLEIRDSLGHIPMSQDGISIGTKSEGLPGPIPAN